MPFSGALWTGRAQCRRRLYWGATFVPEVSRSWRARGGEVSNMAGSVNKVILMGNLGKDPEVRHTQDGRPIANLRVATTDNWRDKTTGERREKTEWHPVVILDRTRGCAAWPSNISRRAPRFMSRVSCRPASGRASMGRTAIRPRWCCKASTRAHHARWAARAEAGRSGRVAAAISAAPGPSAAAARIAAPPSTKSSTTRSRSRA